MTYPTVFQNVTTNQPGSVLDTMFNIVGQQGNIPCTATGINGISLSPGTNFFVPTSYTSGQLFSFVAVATSTATVNIQVGGLAFFPLFMPSFTAAGAGNVVAGTPYVVQYTTASTLNGGAGAFLIVNGTTATAVSSPVGGSFKKLKLITTSDATLTPTADEIIVENAAGGTIRLTAVAPAVTNTGSVSLPNGIVAAVANSTWYAFWLIYNPSIALSASNPGGWLDTNFTAPTPPAGYTYWMRAGAFLTDTLGHLNRTLQLGRRAQYVVAGAGLTTPALPQIANSSGGAVGNVTTPTYVSVSVTGVVPPTASRIQCVLSGANAGGGETAAIVAPNANYGGIQSTTNPPPVAQSHVTGMTFASILQFEFQLESTSLSWATSATNSQLWCMGWEDNLT